MKKPRSLRGHIADGTFAFLATCVSLPVLVLIVRRAAAVPLTYDEAASYLRFIDTDLLSVFNFEVATNHLLATVMTRILHAAFGDSELVLRLPSVLGFMLFSAASYLIAARVTDRLIGLAGFTLVHLNPYLLDYFALSRGYGLSLGFLMPGLYFLLRFFERRDDTRAAPRLLYLCLIAAGAAVLSIFTLLSVYLAIVVVIVASQVLANTPPPNQWLVDRQETLSRRWKAALPVVCVSFVFSAVVFSQDAGLTGRLYEEVVVRIGGLEERTAGEVGVLRIDLRGRTSAFVRRGFTWSLNPATHVARVRIELPQAVAAQVAFVEVSIGDRVFWARELTAPQWTSDDRNGQRVFESAAALSLATPRNRAFTPIINWAGEAPYLREVALHAAGFAVFVAAIAIVLEAIGVFARRRGLLFRREWPPVLSSLVWVATLAGPPLYILRHRGELYFGAPTLLETFRSLVRGFFYGRSYFPFQESVLLVGAAATVVAALLMVRVGYCRQRMTSVNRLVVLGSLILLVSLSLIAQNILFGTPYLSGRTALLYVPLCILFVVFLCDQLAGIGPRIRTATRVALGAIVGLFAAHLGLTANTTYVLDWRDDAATKMMIGDVRDAAASAASSRVILGVDRRYFPVAVFYATRSGAGIDVHVLPASTRVDYVYRPIREAPATGIIARYRVAGSVLAVRSVE